MSDQFDNWVELMEIRDQQYMLWQKLADLFASKSAIRVDPTLLEVAEHLLVLKDAGISSGSVLYCIDKVWGGDE